MPPEQHPKSVSKPKTLEQYKASVLALHLGTQSEDVIICVTYNDILLHSLIICDSEAG